MGGASDAVRDKLAPVLPEGRSQPFEIAYEDLVENFESTVSAILGYLDLPIAEGLGVAPPRLQKAGRRPYGRMGRSLSDAEGIRSECRASVIVIDERAMTDLTFAPAMTAREVEVPDASA